MKIAGLFLFLTVASGCASYQPPAAKPDSARTESCKATSTEEIAALFDRWNQTLLTGDPHKVVANYAEHSILLPTVSNKIRMTPAEKEDYFEQFLEIGRASCRERVCVPG